jgi:hypothetical protein
MENKALVTSPAGGEVQDETAMRIAKDDPARPRDAWMVDEIASREPNVQVPTPAAIQEKN